MIIKDINITINVSNLDQSISFYESLGFILKNRWGAYYAQLALAGIIIGLHPAVSENLKGGSGNVSIGFTMEDFEATKAELQTLSINFEERVEEGGQFLHLKDPDGNALYFIKPKW